MQNFVEIFRRPDLRDEVGQFRGVAIEFAQDSWHRPDKHSRVPAKISFSQKGLGQIDIRFFAKADDAVNSDFSIAAQSHWLTLLDVTETGARPGRFDSNRYERARFLRGRSRGFHCFLKCGAIGNDVVRWKRQHPDFPVSFSRTGPISSRCLSRYPFQKRATRFRWIICSRSRALRLDLESECLLRTKSNGQPDRRPPSR